MEYITFEDKNVMKDKVNLNTIKIFGIDGLFTLDKIEKLIIQSWNEITKNDVNDVNDVITELLNNGKTFQELFSIKHNTFESIGIEYSNNKNKKLEKVLIFLDIIRKYIVICLLSNLQYYGTKLFNSDGVINSKYGIIVAPGSGNITSDWDITFFLTQEGVEFFKKSKVSNKRLLWLKEECYFHDFFDNHYTDFSLLYDNNFYIEMCEKRGKAYKIPIFLNKSKLDVIDFIKLELKYLKKKEKKTKETVSLKKQLNFTLKTFENMHEPKIAFQNYLSSREYKSDAYSTLSSVLCVVIEGQLGLDIKDILEKHVGLYLMSAVENTLDLKNHIQKHKNNISKIKKGKKDHEIILKYSKYLKRLNDHLKLFEYGLFLIVDKDNNNYLDVYEFQNFKKILHPIYGNEFNMDNNGNNKEISLKEMKKIKTDRCFGESTDNLNNLVLFRSGKNIKLK